MTGYKANKCLFVVLCLESDELKFQNKFCASAAHMLWSVDLSRFQFHITVQQDRQTQHHHHIRLDGVTTYTAQEHKIKYK